LKLAKVHHFYYFHGFWLIELIKLRINNRNGNSVGRGYEKRALQTLQRAKGQKNFEQTGRKGKTAAKITRKSTRTRYTKMQSWQLL